VILINILLGLLDLIGVIAIGLVGSLAVVGVSSSQPNPSLNSVLSHLQLQNQSFQVQASILALTACSVFLIRTVASVFLTRKILHFLSRKGARLASELLNKLLKLPVNEIQTRTVGDLSYVLNEGVTSITLGVIGLTLAFISDFVLLSVLSFGLFLINPSIALTSIISFGFTGVILFSLTKKRAKRIGEQNAKYSVKLYSEVGWLFSNYRELFVKARLAHYKIETDKIRTQLAGSLAEQQFLPNVSKYVIESSLILIGLIVSAVQFLTGDAVQAVTALSIFLAAGSRLAPIVMRMQQNAIQIRTNSGTAKSALALFEEVRMISPSPIESIEPDYVYSNFVGEIEVNRCSYSYSTADTFAIQEVSFNVQLGEQVAIVGPSGSGKSTLTDLLLGILEPESGNIRISGMAPRDAIERWPGAMSYVPQQVHLRSGSIYENIAQGFEITEDDHARIDEIISVTQLTRLKKDLENNGASILELGNNLSGGQKQRLGIARSLYTNPKLIVLDEATSALDGQTEMAISSVIQALKGSVTVIMIAHRLSTIRQADKIIYLDHGKISAVGSIEEVKSKVPDFALQAKLMGL
jgi:ATP-binding cassette subfamily C protein